MSPPEDQAVLPGRQLINRRTVRAEYIEASDATFWRWERAGVLVPVRINGKPFYRRADCDALVQDGSSQQTSVTVRQEYEHRHFTGGAIERQEVGHGDR